MSDDSPFVPLLGINTTLRCGHMDTCGGRFLYRVADAMALQKEAS